MDGIDVANIIGDDTNDTGLRRSNRLADRAVEVLSARLRRDSNKHVSQTRSFEFSSEGSFMSYVSQEGYI